MSPENIDKFDKSIIDLDIRFFLFSNRDFKNIIRYSKKLNIRIKSIETEDTDEEFNEEINEFIENREYDNLIKFIDENHIIIKTLDFLYPLLIKWKSLHFQFNALLSLIS